MKKKQNKTSNSEAVRMTPQHIDYDNYVVDVKYTDKGGFRISLDMLNKLSEKARLAGKLPLLSIGIKKNETEIVVLNVTIHTEKK